MMKVRVTLFLLMIFALGACQTRGVLLKETPLNVSETRRVIVSVIGEPRSLSQNGRELSSQYYDRKQNEIKKMEMARERLFTHITVLGDRRPYDVQVEVLVESRNQDGAFELVGSDDNRAAVIADKLKKALHQSRDKRNVIDDFRSF